MIRCQLALLLTRSSIKPCQCLRLLQTIRHYHRPRPSQTTIRPHQISHLLQTTTIRHRLPTTTTSHWRRTTTSQHQSPTTTNRHLLLITCKHPRHFITRLHHHLRPRLPMPKLHLLHPSLPTTRVHHPLRPIQCIRATLNQYRDMQGQQGTRSERLRNILTTMDRRTELPPIRGIHQPMELRITLHRQMLRTRKCKLCQPNHMVRLLHPHSRGATPSSNACPPNPSEGARPRGHYQGQYGEPTARTDDKARGKD